VICRPSGAPRLSHHHDPGVALRFTPGYHRSPLRGCRKGNMARILLTGGAGYIGSHTVKELLARGHEVTVFDNLSAGHRQAVPAGRLVVGDLRDIDHLDQLLVVNRIEGVIHFAAHCYVGESVTDPAKYYTNNLVYALNLIDRCRRNGVG